MVVVLSAAAFVFASEEVVAICSSSVASITLPKLSNISAKEIAQDYLFFPYE